MWRSWRTPREPRTHREDMSPHKKSPGQFEPRTFWLCGDSVNHCTPMSPCLQLPKIIQFLLQMEALLCDKATKFLKLDVIRRAHLFVHAAPFPKRTPVASLSLSCCNSLSVDELGGPTSDDSTINLLEERGWAGGRWKKGRNTEVKRQSASPTQPPENTGKPCVLT